MSEAAAAWEESPAQADSLAAPLLCGLLDVGPIFLYIFGHSPVPFYSATLAAKLLIAITARVPAAARLAGAWPLLAYIAILTLFDLAFLDVNAFDAVQVLGFVVEIGLTLSIVNPAQIRAYLAVYAYAILLNIMLYVWEVHHGYVGQQAGRFFYFQGLHPNLGSEIAATGMICAALAFPGWLFALAWLVEISAVLLMQGRAAMLVAAGIAIVMSARGASRFGQKYRFAGLAAMVAAAAAFVALFQPISEKLARSASNDLLLNNPYRGASSGVSGRDIGWHEAIAAFERSPLTGVGVGYFNDPMLAPPHNLPLFFLAQFGVLGLPMLGYIIYKYKKLFTQERFRFLVWAQFLPLLLLNDRMFNMNPYPFVFYVVMLAV